MSEVLTLATNAPGVVIAELTTPADDIAYVESVLASQAHLMRFSPETVDQYKTPADAEASRAAAQASGKLRFGIWDDGEFAGSVNRTPLAGYAEVGYWIDVRHTGKGLATVALAAVTDYTAEEGEFQILVALIDPDNAASQRVAQKAGYEQTSRTADRLTYTWVAADLLAPTVD